MKIRFQLSILLLGMATMAAAQATARPNVPDAIKAPAGESVVLVAHATGSQIYVCRQGSDGAYAWTLKAPDAELHDQQGAVIGRHYAGPTWKDNDGSEVTGKAVAHVDSLGGDSIPWLLVSASGHAGDGVLSHVSSIQRIRTQGGQPPAASDCSAANQNAEVTSKYTADYYFYASGK